MRQLTWFVLGALAASAGWLTLIYLRNEQLLMDVLGGR